MDHDVLTGCGRGWLLARGCRCDRRRPRYRILNGGGGRQGIALADHLSTVNQHRKLAPIAVSHFDFDARVPS